VLPLCSRGPQRGGVALLMISPIHMAAPRDHSPSDSLLEYPCRMIWVKKFASVFLFMYGIYPCHVHNLSIPCVHHEHTAYLFLVLTLNTQLVHTMCSSWTLSLSIPCVYLEHIACPYHLFSLNTQPNHTMCSTWTPSLFITCVNLEHTA